MFIFAYIDPNTGGMLFQVLAAGFALFSGSLLIFSRQIRTGFARLKRMFRQDTAAPTEPEAAATEPEAPGDAETD